MPSTTISTAGGLARLVAERAAELRADRGHEALRHRLLADLYDTAAEVESDDLVDAWCKRDAGTILFSAAGPGGLDYAHIREAAIRAMELDCLRSGEGDDHIVLVLPGAPKEEWIADTVSTAFGVKLAWREGRDWTGPAAHLITPGDLG